MSLVESIKHEALRAGFDLVGVAPVETTGDLEFARRWTEKGFGGEMRYLHNPRRNDPRLILPSARSVVCVAIIYNAPLPYSTEVTKQASATEEGPRGWISRYAWGRDYHDVMRARLEKLRAAIAGLAPAAETRVYADTGPIVERAFARLSGIGWMGKNTCLINQRLGSWFFLGVILTSLELTPDSPAFDRCGSCTRCLEACPTGALVEPYVMDASRCLAYFNIELKGSIPEPFREAMGANVFGCDICQDVCPWNGSVSDNHRAATTEEFQPMTVKLEHPSSEVSLFHPLLEALASLSEQGFRRAFARSPIKRAKYRGWLRNLCVAMGNSGDARFAPYLEEAARHSDSVVSEHARWALNALREAGEGSDGEPRCAPHNPE